MIETLHLLRFRCYLLFCHFQSCIPPNANAQWWADRAELFIHIFFRYSFEIVVFLSRASSRDDNSSTSSSILHQSIYIYKENLANIARLVRSFSARRGGRCVSSPNRSFFFARCTLSRCFRWQSRFAWTCWELARSLLSVKYEFIKWFHRRQMRTKRRIWNASGERTPATRKWKIKRRRSRRKNAAKKGIDVREAIRRWHRGDKTVAVVVLPPAPAHFPFLIDAKWINKCVVRRRVFLYRPHRITVPHTHIVNESELIFPVRRRVLRTQPIIFAEER